MPLNKAKEPREDVDFDNFGEGDAKKPGHGVCFYVNKNGLPLDSSTWQRMWDHVSDVHPDGALIQYRIGHEPRLPEVSTSVLKRRLRIVNFKTRKELSQNLFVIIRSDQIRVDELLLSFTFNARIFCLP